MRIRIQRVRGGCECERNADNASAERDERDKESQREQDNERKIWLLSRRDRSPKCKLVSIKPGLIKYDCGRTMSSSLSSFSSSFFSSSLGASAAAAAAPPATGAAPAAGAPPPAPMLESNSLTSLPSRALARSEAQMGSTSTPAAVVKATILSDCGIRCKYFSAW